MSESNYIKYSGCYLLHYENEISYPMAKRYGDSRHYIGYSSDITNRVCNHLIGNGAVHTKKAIESRITIKLVRFWLIDKTHEGLLTSLGASNLCPLCRSGKFKESEWIKNDSYELLIPYENSFDNNAPFWKVDEIFA